MRKLRQCRAFTAAAVVLIALGVSPVTAPFSTFSFGQFAHEAAAFKSIDHLKIDEHSAIEVGSIDGRSAEVPLTECLASYARTAVDWERTRSVVLRI